MASVTGRKTAKKERDTDESTSLRVGFLVVAVSSVIGTVIENV